MRDLGVVFPEDEGWTAIKHNNEWRVGEKTPPWDGQGFFSRFDAYTDDLDWLTSLWNDVTTGGYVCAPWLPTSNTEYLGFRSDPLSGIMYYAYEDTIDGDKNAVCIQTPYGAGMLIVDDLKNVVTRDDHNFRAPGGSNIAPTCHPTIDGIAFTLDLEGSPGTNDAHPVAYTVGSIYDARIPVSSCRD